MKTNKIIIALALMSLLCMATTCEEEKERIPVKFENRTSETLFFVDGNGSSELGKNFDRGFFNGFILPGETVVVTDVSEPYPRDIKRRYYFFIIKESTLKTYTKEELIEHDICDKRYALSFPKLSAMNFTIVYTGE